MRSSFDLHLAIIGLENQCSVFLRMAVLLYVKQQDIMTGALTGKRNIFACWVIFHAFVVVCFLFKFNF